MEKVKQEQSHTTSALAAAAASNFFLASIVLAGGAVVRLREGQYNNWFALCDQRLFLRRFNAQFFFVKVNAVRL